jgi:molecular chaperone HscB
MANSLQSATSTPAQHVTQSCWSCGAMRAAHFCNACGKVQPAAPVDYFTFFGLPRKLNVDLATLEKDFYLLRIEGVELEEQSKAATDQARNTGQVKKQIVPPDLLEEVFELNVQLEELRMQKKVGEDDPALLEEIGKEKLKLEEKHEADLRDLKAYWGHWDTLIEREQHGDAVSPEERKQARDKMVDLLNRRNYIRNLVRDVNEALGQ